VGQYLQSLMASKSQSAQIRRSSSSSSSSSSSPSSEDEGNTDTVGDHHSQGEYEGYQRMGSSSKRRLRELSGATREIFNATNQSFHSAQRDCGDDPVKSATPTESTNCPTAQITLSKVDVQGTVKGGGTAVMEKGEQEYSLILGRRQSSGLDMDCPPFARTASFHDMRILSASAVRAIPGSPGPAIRKPKGHAQARAPVSGIPNSPNQAEPVLRMRESGYSPSTASSSSQHIPEIPLYPPSSSSSVYYAAVRRHISTIPSIVSSKHSSADWEDTDHLEDTDLPDSLLAEKGKSVRERVKELDMAIDQGSKFRNMNERSNTGGGSGKEGFFSRWRE